jgi:hypothetical protein
VPLALLPDWAERLSWLGFPRNRGGLLIADGASHWLAPWCQRGSTAAI